MCLCDFHFTIKPKKLQPKKPRRPKLAGQITKLAQEDINAATVLAIHGRKLTEIETVLSLFYGALEEFNRVKDLKKLPLQDRFNISPASARRSILEQRKMYKNYLNEYGSVLFAIFIGAVTNRDSEKISEIAKAVDFLKASGSGDWLRTRLLILKILLDKKGQKWPIRQVAIFVDWHDLEGVDGFRNLRKICIDLNFPLAPSRNK